VIGFNSTALIEAILAKKKILVPMFGVNKIRFKKKYILDFQKCVFEVNNVKRFEILLHNIINDKSKKKTSFRKSNAVIANYIGNLDGKSSQRLLKNII